MRTKKPALLILVLILALMSANTFAAFVDVPQGASYSGSVDRLTYLGIFSGTSSTTFSPDKYITREQFAKIVTKASGLDDLAATLSGSSSFSDVSPKSIFSGYINLVLNKGYLVGMADGKFHPTDVVNYAQICTVLVKMLGYTDQDLSGTWPVNYIEKAGALGLTKGLGLKSGSPVSRGTIALMIDRLLDTNIKKNNPSEQSRTFISSTGLDSADNYLVYSDPVVVKNFNAATTKAGSIDLTGSYAIIRNTVDNSVSPAVSKIGESITRSQIKDNDIVYQVTDNRNGRKYILVVDNKVAGKLTSVLPDTYTPKTIQIDNKNYDISKYLDQTKINGTYAFNIGDNITALLGHDGKVVDIASTVDSENRNFALVLNNYSKVSTDAADFGTVKYYAKLLQADGNQVTYKLDSAITDYNGLLVKYEVVEGADKDGYETVKLGKIENDNYQEYIIDRENGKVGGNYVTDNVVIFDITNSTSGEAVEARLLKWSDMPDGKVAVDKIRYLNKVGDFGDINVILTNNILDKNIALGLVTRTQQMRAASGTISTYTVNVAGKDYTAVSELPGISVGSVVKVKIGSTGSISIESLEKPYVQATTVEAVDSGRIKVNGTIYQLTNNAAVYIEDSSGNNVRRGTDNIAVNVKYASVAVYLDKSADCGGKAAIIMLLPF